jgi:hypothetical protein
MHPRPPRRRPPRTLAFAALFALAAVAPAAQDDESSSVETAGAVVVHGVDTGTLAARLKAVDRRIAGGEMDAAVEELDALLGEDLDTLHEDSEGVYLSAEDAVLLRIAALPESALAAWRRLADARAQALLAETATGGTGWELLERSARRLALATDGPRLLVALADHRVSRGDLAGAARLLEDLLLLWPADGARRELPGLDRAAVISRLAALAVALDDAASARSLARATPDDLLDGPSAALPGRTLRQELGAAEASARRRTRGEPAPATELRVAAEIRLSPWDLSLPLPDRGREILGRPAAVTSSDGEPMLLARVTDAYGIASRLHAFAPGREPGKTGVLEARWGWPSEEELRRFPRAAGETPFEPVVAGDLVLFCWPSVRVVETDGERHVLAEGDELRDLVVLSLRGEGRLLDERGIGESDREDGDPELERLSFCGPPLVEGRTVYVTLTGRSPNGGATQLHAARFDLVSSGRDVRLRLRWRRHIVDGTPIPPSRYSVHQLPETERDLAFPSGLATRFGLLYVGSNTGAVACLDTRTGRVEWIETYDRLGPSPRHTIAEADPVGWKYGPVRIDGDRVVVAPRDAEELLVYAARPLRSRSMRLGTLAVRGAGTAMEAGSPLGDLEADELVGVRDGHAILSGSLPGAAVGAIRWPAAPLISFRLRAREGDEPVNPISVPEIPELTVAGSPALTPDAVVFPTFKALYSVPVERFAAAPRELWRATAPRRSTRFPDRLGNVVVHRGHVWSITPARIVLLAPQPR